MAGTSFLQFDDGTNLKLVPNSDANATSTLEVTSDPSNPLSTTPATVGAFIDGQATLSVATGTALPSNVCTQGVTLQADPTNTVDVLIGNSAGQHMRLSPGKVATIPVNNTNLVYWKPISATASLLNYWGV